jgi:hypothetical protein
LNAEQRDPKLEDSVWRNLVRNAGFPKSKVGAHTYASFPANAHALHSVLEPGDHAPFSDPERVLLALLHRVSAVQIQVVLHLDGTSASGRRAVSDFQIFVFDSPTTLVHGKLTR